MLTIPDSCVENGIESIPEFFAGKSVFITGGTGFLGKVIIEKILYSCPQVENVYILVREKKKIAAQDRMKALFDCPVFNRLREERPEDLQKIVPIAGDIVAPNLGINAEDEELLMEKVSVVIHSAATVRFNEPLKVALGINVEGTRKVLNLCHRMKNVKLYPPPMDLEKAYELAKDLNGEITQQSLSESLVNDLHGDIPTAIVRPSIAIGKGYCKTIIGDKNNILDVIPVDYVSNAILYEEE
ncbi:Fatty acyl reductase [Operophtera brumata]|uniref:Fatty acyl-CoA reductase n=1 Tax=Operophtera brumata TaxID=104452 RepID=A0A0L7LAY5_OPEBR|nr:Fatty acyl reductase [Operophtera brumata]